MSGEWLEWYYMVFWLPAGVAVLILLLTGLSDALGGDADAGHGDAGMDVDAGLEVDAGLDVHAGMDVDAGLDADAGEIAHAGPGHFSGDGAHGGMDWHHVLHFVGIGRVPLTFAVGSLLLGWGVTGVLALQILQPRLAGPSIFVPASIAAATVGALAIGRAVASAAGAFLPRDEPYNVTRESMVGLTATVVLPVSDTGGRIHVRDASGTLFAWPARVAPGQPTLPAGCEVVITAVDVVGSHMLVEPGGCAGSLPA